MILKSDIGLVLGLGFVYVCAHKAGIEFHSGCDDGPVVANFAQRMGRSGPNSRGNVRAEFFSQSAPGSSHLGGDV